MENRSILISGAGIAGPTLAFWLAAAGFEPVLVEQAPALREAGYVIDFWGLGYDVAERMGLAPDIERIGYHMRELRIVDGRGRRIAGFGTKVFRELTGGRFATLRRSDLSRLLFDSVKGTTQVAFGDEIVAIEQRADDVRIQFKRAPERRFDLVIGADGLHSAVRRLAFGPEERFERRLGYGVAAFEVGCLSSAGRKRLCHLRRAAPDAGAFRPARRSDLVSVRVRRRRDPMAGGARSRGAKGDAARPLRRGRMGDRAGARRALSAPRPLFRSGEPDPDGELVEGPRRARRRRRLLPVADGRARLGARDDRGLCAGGRIGAGRRTDRGLRRYEDSS